MAALNCVLHPHHVSLMEHPFTFQSLFHSFRDRIDPYYEIDHDRSHKRVGRPAFNVTETETAFLLDGEIPGVFSKKQITVEWLQNQVLIIRGAFPPSDTETMKDPFKEGLHNDLAAPKQHEETPLPPHETAELQAILGKPEVKLPRRLLSERQIGEFMRSFTFPTEVDSDGMEANLSNGLLRIVVPKLPGKSSKAKPIQIDGCK